MLPNIFELYHKHKNAKIKCADKSCTKFFVIRIHNYELLSILLSKEQLNLLILEVVEEIASKVSSITNIEATNVISEYQYIAFVIYHDSSFLVDEFSYLIYKSLQLYISKNNTTSYIECKISDVDIRPDNDANVPYNIIHGLMNYSGSGYYVKYDESSLSNTCTKYHQISQFQKDLREMHLSFAYQPIVERTTGHIQYYECLLRIPNDNTGATSVGYLMPIVEEVGLNNVIDQTVLRMAVNELRAAHNISLSVNISNAGIVDPYLLRIACELLSDQSIAKRLIVEITETSMNMDFDNTKYFIDTIRAFGCKIALDDFGTGFTSFKQLQKLPIDVIKIDGSFIRDITYNQKNQHLVVALIDIAEQLGAKTVAEFVENGEIAKFLLDAKIDYMQGNFFSPATNYRSWDKS